MSEVNTSAPPARRSVNYLKAALIASLAVNLLFVGAGVARFYVAHGPERLSRSTQMQLIPRRFFAELERPRRLELLGVIKGYDKDFRDGRRALRQQVNALADALAADPYDEALVKAAVADFSAKSDGLMRTGGDAVLALIGKLDSEERKRLAEQLRARENAARQAPEAQPGPPPPPPPPSN